MPNSPCKVGVLPQYEASKVKAGGDGLDKKGVPASIPVEFTIDASDAGEGHLSVRITDPEGRDKKCQIENNNDGTFTVRYVPDIVGRYTIEINYGGDGIPFSPFPVKAIQHGDAQKCVSKGAGLGPTVPVGKESMISVDTSQAGNAKLTAQAFGPHNEPVDIDVFENTDMTYDVFYTATQVGEYKMALRYGGQHIKNSPFRVSAEKGSVQGSLAAPNHLRYSIIVRFPLRLKLSQTLSQIDLSIPD